MRNICQICLLRPGLRTFSISKETPLETKRKSPKSNDHFYEIMTVETLKLYFWNAHNLLIPNMFIRNFKHQFLKFDRKIRSPLTHKNLTSRHRRKKRNTYSESLENSPQKTFSRDFSQIFALDLSLIFKVINRYNLTFIKITWTFKLDCYPLSSADIKNV